MVKLKHQSTDEQVESFDILLALGDILTIILSFFVLMVACKQYALRNTPTSSVIYQTLHLGTSDNGKQLAVYQKSIDRFVIKLDLSQLELEHSDLKPIVDYVFEQTKSKSEVNAIKVEGCSYGSEIKTLVDGLIYYFKKVPLIEFYYNCNLHTVKGLTKLHVSTKLNQ